LRIFSGLKPFFMGGSGTACYRSRSGSPDRTLTTEASWQQKREQLLSTGIDQDDPT
jgi:hypothetical protein